VIPHRFTYHAPDHIDGVLAGLAEDPEGTVLLAGGSWVVPGLGRGEPAARRVLDLRRAGLAGIHREHRTVRVGACATYAALTGSAELARDAAVLGRMAAEVTGGPQITGRATVGGAAAAARPGSDVPAALTVLDAVAEVASPSGTRRVPVDELWTGAFTTSLAPDEVLTAFEFAPLPAGTGCGYVKLKHGTSCWPIVTAAATITLDATGTCRRAALVIGAACETPVRVPVDGPLDGRPVDGDALRVAGDAARAALTQPWEDELAPAWYRAALAPVAARRALSLALADATGRESR
jgi:carbon-monoxide dehydrogenase medium subunit